MSTRLFILLFCLLAVACGGGGGGFSNPLQRNLSAQMSAINSENLNALMNQIHPDFYENCLDWTEYRDVWDSIFNTPNYSLRFSNLRITASQYDENIGTGYADVTFHVREDDNGTITEFDDSSTFYFEKLGSDWLEIGDGSCIAGRAPKKFLELRSKRTVNQRGEQESRRP